MPERKLPEERVADAMANLTREDLRRSARRDARIEVRVTPEMKENIAGMANELGLSVTEYIETLHIVVSDKLRR